MQHSTEEEYDGAGTKREFCHCHRVVRGAPLSLPCVSFPTLPSQPSVCFAPLAALVLYYGDMALVL